MKRRGTTLLLAIVGAVLVSAAGIIVAAEQDSEAPRVPSRNPSDTILAGRVGDHALSVVAAEAGGIVQPSEACLVVRGGSLNGASACGERSPLLEEGTSLIHTTRQGRVSIVGLAPKGALAARVDHLSFPVNERFYEIELDSVVTSGGVHVTFDGTSASFDVAARP